MAEMDALFEQAVADVQEQYEKASADWKPDPGKYLCQLTEMRRGVKKYDDGSQMPWAVPQYKIVEGSLAESTFSGDFFSTKDQQALSRLKGFLAKVLGETPAVLAQGFKDLDEMIEGGILCMVEVSVSKKGYTNCRLASVIHDDKTAAA